MTTQNFDLCDKKIIDHWVNVFSELVSSSYIIFIINIISIMNQIIIIKRKSIHNCRSGYACLL